MRTTITILVAVLAAVLATSCQSAGSAQERQQASELRKNESACRKKAEQFIRHAQRGDSTAMVKMFSRVGIQELGGEAAVKSKLESEVLHAFKNARIDWDRESQWKYSPAGSMGLCFHCRAVRGEWSNRIHVLVCPEDGRLAISGFWES